MGAIKEAIVFFPFFLCLLDMIPIVSGVLWFVILLIRHLSRRLKFISNCSWCKGQISPYINVIFLVLPQINDAVYPSCSFPSSSSYASHPLSRKSCILGEMFARMAAVGAPDWSNLASPSTI